MPTKTIAVPLAVYDRVKEAAATEGTTVEKLTTQALERALARRWLERIGREADFRRGAMSETDVDALVERVVRESLEGEPREGLGKDREAGRR